MPLDVVASRISGMLRSIIAQMQCSDSERLRRELAVSFDLVFNGIIDRRS
jgi:hypothetical protein